MTFMHRWKPDVVNVSLHLEESFMMSTQITMPALSPTMEEGNLAKWHVKAGDKIEPGQVIAEIETDKATMEVEAVDEGVIEEILVPEGAEGVKVNTPIATLAGEGEAAKPAKKARAARASEATPPPRRGRAGGAERARLKRAPTRPTTSCTQAPRRDASSRRRSRAGWPSRAASISAALHGSGPNGRIVKADIEAAAKSPRARRSASAAAIA